MIMRSIIIYYQDALMYVQRIGDDYYIESKWYNISK